MPSPKENKLQAQLDAMRNSLYVLDPKMKPVRKGQVAETFVKYQLERRGISYFEPPSQTEACDILIQGDSGAFYRCEVKSTAVIDSVVTFRKSTYKRGGYKTIGYTKEDKVDFFIAVDLTTEVLAIIPSSVVVNEGWVEVRLHTNSKVAPYLGRFDQLI